MSARPYLHEHAVLALGAHSPRPFGTLTLQSPDRARMWGPVTVVAPKRPAFHPVAASYGAPTAAGFNEGLGESSNRAGRDGKPGDPPIIYRSVALSFQEKKQTSV